MKWKDRYKRLVISVSSSVRREEGGYYMLGNIYLHGSLEMGLGTDLFTAYNVKSFGHYYPTLVSSSGKEKVINKFYYEGEVEVRVLGFPEVCIGIFWIGHIGRTLHDDGTMYLTWEQLGLICLKEDKDSIDYAKRAKERGFKSL